MIVVIDGVEYGEEVPARRKYDLVRLQILAMMIQYSPDNEEAVAVVMVLGEVLVQLYKEMREEDRKVALN